MLIEKNELCYDTLLGPKQILLQKVDYYMSEDKADSMGISGFQIEIYVSKIDGIPSTLKSGS